MAAGLLWIGKFLIFDRLFRHTLGEIEVDLVGHESLQHLAQLRGNGASRDRSPMLLNRAFLDTRSPTAAAERTKTRLAQICSTERAGEAGTIGRRPQEFRSIGDTFER